MLKLLKYEFRKTMFPKLILLAAFVIMEGCIVEGWMVDIQYPVEHPFVSTMLENRWLVVGFLVIVASSEDESQNNDSCQYYYNIR